MSRGQKAIRHAITVYGPEKGKQFLLQQARQIPASNAESLDSRAKLIGWLFAHHNYYPPVKVEHLSVDGEVTDKDTAIADQVLNLVQGRPLEPGKRGLRRNVRTTLRHTIEVILVAYRGEKTRGTSEWDGTVAISYRTLAAEITKRWPDNPVNHSNVEDALLHIIGTSPTSATNEDTCCTEILIKQQVSRVPRIEANRYKIGRDLDRLLNASVPS